MQKAIQKNAYQINQMHKYTKLANNRHGNIAQHICSSYQRGQKESLVVLDQ